MLRKSVVLAALLAALLLGTGVAQGTVRLEWMSWGDQLVIDRNERIIQAYYEAFPERDVIIENNVVSWDFYKERLPVLVASGATPDIVSLDGSFMYGQIAHWGALVDLTERVIAYAEEFFPGVLDTITVDGKIYGFPFHGWDTSPASLVNYNRQAFGEAGLPNPTYDWTWDDLVSWGKKLTAPDENRWAIDFGASPHIALWMPLLYGFGGRMYAPDRSESLINSPEAAEAFRFAKELDVVHGLQAPGTLVNQKLGFITGQVAMTTNWHQEAIKIMDYVRFDSDITILPKGPVSHGFHPRLTMHTMGIFKGSQHVEEAWHFIEWVLTSPEALQARGPTLAMVPLRANLPVLIEMLGNDEPALAAWRATEAVFARLMPEPVDGVGVEYPHTIEIITSSLEEYFTGNESIEQILENAKSQIDRLLAELSQ